MTTAVNSAANIKMDYMKLLIAQMQNQNPLEPMSNTEMASQMAQFSQLEQLEQMNTSFSSVLKNSQLSYANSLIGKRVVYEDADNNNELVGGDVSAVGISGDDIMLKVGTKEVNVNDVLAIGQ
jgi:flagellar basal-body rod modification protein FlgD